MAQKVIGTCCENEDKQAKGDSFFPCLFYRLALEDVAQIQSGLHTSKDPVKKKNLSQMPSCLGIKLIPDVIKLTKKNCHHAKRDTADEIMAIFLIGL